MTNRPLLEVQTLNLVTRRTQRRLLSNLNFSLDLGERLALVGASGSGKTLLLKLLNRLIEPSSGQILFRGQSVQQYPIQQLRSQIMLVPANSPLFGQTVQDVLCYPLQLQQLSPLEQQDRFNRWLAPLQIPQDWLDRKVAAMSSAEHRWLAIARAFISEPAILLLDDPIPGLNPQDAIRFKQLLCESELTQHWAVVISDANLEWLKPLATRCLLLDQGNLELDQPLLEVNWQLLETRLQTATMENESW